MADNGTNYTSADDWAADAVVALPAPLDVPSGKTALVRAPGLEAFMKAGMIPNTLMGLIKKALDSNKGKAKTPAQERKEMDAMFDQITKDPEKLEDLFTLADAVTVYCVVKPVVKAVPVYTEGDGVEEDMVGKQVPIEERPPRDGFLWVDQVDLNDKMFIFNYACAGTRDVERFRDESADVMGRAGHGKPVARTTKRTAGSKKAQPRRGK